MKSNRLLTPVLIALALLVPVVLMARADLRAQEGASPASVTATAADQARTAELVYGLLSNSNFVYRPRPLDETMAVDIFERYLKALDFNRMYFTAGDIEDFAHYRTGLGDALRNGDLEPANEIFARFQQRVDERVSHARALLDQDIFDFDGNDRWEYDRKDAEWAADTAELDALWRQSVRYDWLRLRLANRDSEQIRTTLDRRYRNLATFYAQQNQQDSFQTFLNAYTTSIDPHTAYYNPRSTQLFNQSMSLSLEGIGAQLQRQDDVAVIRELIAGGPAALSGLFTPGDRIVGVGQDEDGEIEDVVGWRLDDVVEKIKGPAGSSVQLEVIPAGAGMDGESVRIVLTRARVRLEEQAAKSEILTVPANPAQEIAETRIGVVELPTFYQDFSGRRDADGNYASATRDVARILEEFKREGVDGVVLDLRNNGGGSLNEAVELTGLFIDTGPVVQVRESGGRVKTEGVRTSGVTWDGPLAVLINRSSASASEIVAGAIQDYGRGLVIGETTFGKGTVQNLIDLDRQTRGTTRFGSVKLTVAQFFLPGGSSTQNRGVVPDIRFPVTVDASEYGESTNENALPWTQIAAVPHTLYGDFGPMLADLDERHQARVGEDLEFQWWVEDVNEFRAERERKYVSLNEAERRAERERNEQKRRDRQQVRRELGMPLDPLAEDNDDGLQASERDISLDTAREKAAEDRPDPLLNEAAAILADAIHLLEDNSQLAAQVLPVSTQVGSWAR